MIPQSHPSSRNHGKVFQIEVFFQRPEGLVASDAGLFILNDGKASIVPGFSGVDVHAIAPSQDNGWWIGVYGDGLYRTDSRFNILRHYSGNNILPSDFVRVLQTDTHGRLWVGTYDGLAVYDDLNGTFRVCRHDRTNFSLSHNSVRAIYSDSQNGIWIGTWFGGVNYWNPQDEKLSEIPLSGDGIYGFVSCLCPDPASDNIWIGTNDDGIFLYSPHDRSVSCQNIPILRGNIKCIVPGQDGFLYIGMHMGGIIRLDIHNFKAQGFAINNRAPIKNGCYSLLEISNGQWLVGSLEGLFLFDVHTGDLSLHPAIEVTPELGRRIITVLFKDRSGRIWIGTDEGLFRLSSPTGNIQTESEIFTNISSAGFHVNQILQDTSGKIWIATSQGLIEYSGISEPRLYTVQDGLPDNNIRSMLGNDKNLLLCFGKHICLFNLDTRSATVINRPTSNEFVEGAACTGSNGLVYFGGLSGLTCFNPDDLYSNPYSPKPYFSDVDFDIRNHGEIERNNLGACISVRLPSNKGPLIAHWAVVNPLSYGKDNFLYRLDGLDDKWHRTGDHQASFNNLAPGNYTLQLRCMNNDGVYCDGYVPLEIHILPRWWQSGLFRTLLIFLSVIFLGLAALLTAAALRAKMELRVRNAEIRRLEDNLEKTRDLFTGQLRSGYSEEPSVADEFLHRATKVVEANMDNEAFSSEEFARQMYMSRSKLYSRIQETTGGTVSDFIRNIRLDRACKLLMEGRYSVSEISARVGFSSPSYFATSFKKHIGCLPKDYGKSASTTEK
ncbi:MAG: helix-turn-helix domain-containing protein [Bacteroidales bacterium]|nr:helix-turn-helix domain-containing protein [Bacteroidales bacterium]